MITAQLISRSCTTAWSDWNHGDLFLTADSLVRVRLPEPTPAGRRLRDTVGPEPQFRWLPALAEAQALMAVDPTNRYLSLAEVVRARLHRGLLSDRLAVESRDGTRHKLLWLRADPAYDILRTRLPELIGGAFELD